MDTGLSQAELELDDVRPLPSGIKIRTGPVLPPEETPSEHSPDDSITDLLEEAEDENQCMADFFPENDVDSISVTSMADEVCTNDEGLF